MHNGKKYKTEVNKPRKQNKQQMAKASTGRSDRSPLQNKKQPAAKNSKQSNF